MQVLFYGLLFGPTVILLSAVGLNLYMTWKLAAVLAKHRFLTAHTLSEIEVQLARVLQQQGFPFKRVKSPAKVAAGKAQWDKRKAAEKQKEVERGLFGLDNGPGQSGQGV